MSAFVAFWDDYFFEPWPAARLAAARIALFAVVLWHYKSFSFAAPGRMPTEFYEPVGAFLWFDWPQPTEWALNMVWMGFILAALCALLGFGTRKSCAASAAGLWILLSARYSFGKVDHGGIIMIFAMVLLAAGPSGATLSVDAWWARRKAAWQGNESVLEPLAPAGGYAWPVRLLLLHLALFYFFSGWSKVVASGFAWADGNALESYLLYRGVPLGVAIANVPLLCMVLSVSALAFELTFPVGVLIKRLRVLFLLGGLGMHLGIWWTMDIVFKQTMLTYVVFVDWPRLGLALQRLGRRTPKRATTLPEAPEALRPRST